MGHSVEAIVGKTELITSLADDWVSAKATRLEQGFSMIKMEDQLIDDISELANLPQNNIVEGFEFLTLSLESILKQKAIGAEIAYIETEYFGGSGVQAAILYKNGAPATEPLRTVDSWDNDSQSLIQEPSGERAINIVLNLLGVRKEKDCDEFGSIKLGWHRN